MITGVTYAASSYDGKVKLNKLDGNLKYCSTRKSNTMKSVVLTQ